MSSPHSETAMQSVIEQIFTSALSKAQYHGIDEPTFVVFTMYDTDETWNKLCQSVKPLILDEWVLFRMLIKPMVVRIDEVIVYINHPDCLTRYNVVDVGLTLTKDLQVKLKKSGAIAKTFWREQYN